MLRPFMVEFTGTPEARKTTVIGNISNKLLNLGYSVLVLKESAEKLPDEIPKGTWDANLWMHYQTQSGVLKAMYSKADIVLIDRGLLDSKFYGNKFFWTNMCSKEQYDKFNSQFMEELFPDFLVAMKVSPKIAVQRRGGEGRLVNESYIQGYNQMFERYYKELECNRVLIDTSNFDVYQMNSKIFDEIYKTLP